MVKCCLIGCKSNSETNQQIKFVKFPEPNTPSYKKWIRQCQESKRVINAHPSPHVCWEHFDVPDDGEITNSIIPTLKLNSCYVLTALDQSKERIHLLDLINETLLEWSTRAYHYPKIAPECKNRSAHTALGSELLNMLDPEVEICFNKDWWNNFEKMITARWKTCDLNKKCNKSLSLANILKQFSRAISLKNGENLVSKNGIELNADQGLKTLELDGSNNKAEKQCSDDPSCKYCLRLCCRSTYSIPKDQRPVSTKPTPPNSSLITRQQCIVKQIRLQELSEQIEKRKRLSALLKDTLWEWERRLCENPSSADILTAAAKVCRLLGLTITLDSYWFDKFRKHVSYVPLDDNICRSRCLDLESIIREIDPNVTFYSEEDSSFTSTPKTRYVIRENKEAEKPQVQNLLDYSKFSGKKYVKRPKTSITTQVKTVQKPAVGEVLDSPKSNAKTAQDPKIKVCVKNRSESCTDSRTSQTRECMNATSTRNLTRMSNASADNFSKDKSKTSARIETQVNMKDAITSSKKKTRTTTASSNIVKLENSEINLETFEAEPIIELEDDTSDEDDLLMVSTSTTKVSSTHNGSHSVSNSSDLKKCENDEVILANCETTGVKTRSLLKSKSSGKTCKPSTSKTGTNIIKSKNPKLARKTYETKMKIRLKKNSFEEITAICPLSNTSPQSLGSSRSDSKIINISTDFLKLKDPESYETNSKLNISDPPLEIKSEPMDVDSLLQTLDLDEGNVGYPLLKIKSEDTGIDSASETHSSNTDFPTNLDEVKINDSDDDISVMNEIERILKKTAHQSHPLSYINTENNIDDEYLTKLDCNNGLDESSTNATSFKIEPVDDFNDVSVDASNVADNKSAIQADCSGNKWKKSLESNIPVQPDVAVEISPDKYFRDEVTSISVKSKPTIFQNKNSQFIDDYVHSYNKPKPMLICEMIERNPSKPKSKIRRVAEAETQPNEVYKKLPVKPKTVNSTDNILFTRAKTAKKISVKRKKIADKTINKLLVKLPTADSADNYLNSDDSVSGNQPKLNINSYKGALEYLKPLEDFVLRREDYRAIGVVSNIEIHFKQRAALRKENL